MNATEFRNRIEPLIATGLRVNGHEFGEEIAPEYRGKTYGYDGLAKLPDGTLVFAIEDSGGSHTGLYAEAVSMDAGDNIIRVSVASEEGSTQGLCAPEIPRTNIALTKVGRRLLGWLK